MASLRSPSLLLRLELLSLLRPGLIGLGDTRADIFGQGGKANAAQASHLELLLLL